MYNLLRELEHCREFWEYAVYLSETSDKSSSIVEDEIAPHNLFEQEKTMQTAALTEFISLLGKRGVLTVLGVRCTAGSINRVPPLPCTLIESFNKDHSNIPRPLSVGGRAYMKHCHRSSDGWWGNGNGSNEVKVGFNSQRHMEGGGQRDSNDRFDF